jgi:sec-independent protein translocase protein TatA
MISGLVSPVHLIIILVIILLLFGAKRLPEMGRSLGQGIQEFKEGLNRKDDPEEKHPEAVEEGQKPATQAVQGEKQQEEEKVAHTKGQEPTTHREE